MQFRNTSAINPQRPEALVETSSGVLMANGARVAFETHLMNSLSIGINVCLRVTNTRTKTGHGEPWNLEFAICNFKFGISILAILLPFAPTIEPIRQSRFSYLLRRACSPATIDQRTVMNSTKSRIERSSEEFYESKEKRMRKLYRGRSKLHELPVKVRNVWKLVSPVSYR